MSDRNRSVVMKSASEGEIIEESRLIEESSRFPETKLKRTFTLPRNPFGSHRLSKRKAKHKEGNNNNVGAETMQEIGGKAMENNNKKVFRKPSWRKFFHKMVQHMSTVAAQSKSNACAGHEFHRRRDGVSLSSGDLRVPPTRGAIRLPGDAVPGVTGLRNHGNTCFINAVLQCLSHTDMLAEYFVLDQYKVDLSRRNKLNARRNGTRGEVTEQLAVLLKAIWTCRYEPELSSRFKVAVDKHGSQYRGTQQHDAQEFLVWLLDKVHEDLNTASKKKYKLIKSGFGRADELVAAETLANHVRCNNSFVHAVFQAQFRSSLTCERCRRQSNTFDPFLCASVPLPQSHRRPVFATVLYLTQQPGQVRLGLSVSPHGDVKELRELLASDTGISEEHMLLTEIDHTGFHRTFSDMQPLSLISETDPVYCLELPQLGDIADDGSPYLLLVWVNVLGEGDDARRFGRPCCMMVGRETGYADLQKLMLKEMHTMLHDNVLESAQEVPLFTMRVTGGEGGALDPTLEHPLYAESVDAALAMCLDGPPHLKLTLEWTDVAKEAIVADDNDLCQEHASVGQMKAGAEVVSLEECFELYTRAETLAADDAWHCPHCDRKQEVVKKLGLWSLPDVLVVHLKRFRQHSCKQRRPAKLTSLVDFPLYGLDMSPHLATRSVGSPAQGGKDGVLGWSPWKRPRRQPARQDDNVFDLYAVCNHHGSDLQGGHYTAHCRNPYDGAWYCFDDTRVEATQESALVTPAAYILFYQRRGSGSANPDHWVYRMPEFPVAVGNKRSSQSQEELSQAFARTSRNYATMPSRKSAALEIEPKEAEEPVKAEDPPKAIAEEAEPETQLTVESCV